MKNWESIRLILLVIALLFLIVCINPPKAKSFPVVGVGVLVPVNTNYDNCLNNCLAFNGYNNNTYNFCQNQCLYTPQVIIGGEWYGGVWYPRGHFGGHGYDRGHDRDHDNHNHNGHR